MSDEKSSLGQVFWLTAPFVYILGVIVGGFLWFFLGKMGASPLILSVSYHVPLSISAIIASILLWKASNGSMVLIYRFLGRVAAIVYFSTLAFSIVNIVNKF